MHEKPYQVGKLRDDARQRQHRIPWAYFAMLLFLVIAFVATVVVVTLCESPDRRDVQQVPPREPRLPPQRQPGATSLHQVVVPASVTGQGISCPASGQSPATDRWEN